MESSSEWPVSPTRTAMTIGAVTASLMLLVSTFGWQIAGWLIFLGGVYWGMKRFRNELGGNITWIRAWNAGFQTSFFASLIMAFVGYMTTKLEPSIIAEMLDAVALQLKAYPLPEGIADMVMQRWREILSPVMFAAIIIFMYSAIGCLASMIYAFFVHAANPVNQ
jgi:hypothetical protein